MTPAPEAQPAYAELQQQLTGELDKAATHAFSGVFLIAAALALLALLPIAVSGARTPPGAPPRGRRRRRDWPSSRRRGSWAPIWRSAVPPISRARSPTRARRDRSRSCARASGGLFERIGLSALDGAACRLRVTREELALALAGEDARREFVASHRITDAGLEDAVREGARRAIADERRRGSISPAGGVAARTRRRRRPGRRRLLDALQSSDGRSVIDLLSGLLGGNGG